LELESNLGARTEELTNAHGRITELQQRLGQVEGQLDHSQLQAAELAERVERHHVASGEIGGLLSDVMNKLRDIQPR
jgi:chromosome segregation ATPase